MYFDAEDNQAGKAESIKTSIPKASEAEEEIFFRDLNDYIFGNPNNVLVTLRVSKEIDD